MRRSNASPITASLREGKWTHRSDPMDSMGMGWRDILNACSLIYTSRPQQDRIMTEAPVATPALYSPTPPTLASFVRNLRDLPSALTISGITAGFIVVLINYTGPLLIVLQAAAAGGLTSEQTASWVWGVVVGNGVMTVLMSLLFRMPITAPYTTAGAALLVVSLGQYSLNEAIGAYILANGAIMLLGISGLFGRVMRLIPQPIVMAVLAGVLLRFGLNIFNALDDAPGNPVVIAPMVIVFFALRRFRFRAPTLGAMAAGIAVAALQGRLDFPPLALTLTLPRVYLPVFTMEAALGLALPLFALSVSSQYAPGQAVLLANRYDAPINAILTISGGFSMLLALFGAHGTTLGALTAAIVVGPDAQPDISKRYASAVASGTWHILLGLFGATVVDLFSGFPGVFVSTIAGLSLSGIIASSLGGAFERPEYRDAAIVAFLCTAGDFSLFTIGAPFWGLVAGVGVHAIMTARRQS